MLSNAGLSVLIENVNGLNTTTADVKARQNTYFRIILWSTFGLSMVRFIGVSSWCRLLNRGLTAGCLVFVLLYPSQLVPHVQAQLDGYFDLEGMEMQAGLARLVMT